jgi:hypothetical protein
VWHLKNSRRPATILAEPREMKLWVPHPSSVFCSMDGRAQRQTVAHRIFRALQTRFCNSTSKHTKKRPAGYPVGLNPFLEENPYRAFINFEPVNHTSAGCDGGPPEIM